MRPSGMARTVSGLGMDANGTVHRRILIEPEHVGVQALARHATSPHALRC